MGDRCVYIIEDETALRTLIREIVSRACNRVEEFSSAESFLIDHHHRPAGCILLDIGLPGIDGLELLELIARGRAAYPVIILSGRGSVPAAVRAGQLGVIDFIEKPFRADELLAAVRKAFELLGAQLTQLGALETLTPRETQVLCSYVDGAPNKVVAHSLGISVRTVEGYRANVMKKLRVRSLAQALFLARDGGYL
jgi:FixJ family two-component response regulator